MIASPNSFTPPVRDSLHAQYLALVPRIENHACIVFRDVLCHDRRADLIAEAVALGWRWFMRLNERGKDVHEFPAAFAVFVARAIKAGRRITGQEKPKDVLSPLAQRRHNFKVEVLPGSFARSHEMLCGSVRGQKQHDAYEERLTDNTWTPPDEQAMFRLDFAGWLKTLTGRERRLIRAMAMNERTKDLSRQFELSPGRISQMRREFHESWQRFVGDAAEEGTAVV
jgi:hypothetical protein